MKHWFATGGNIENSGSCFRAGLGGMKKAGQRVKGDFLRLKLERTAVYHCHSSVREKLLHKTHLGMIFAMVLCGMS